MKTIDLQSSLRGSVRASALAFALLGSSAAAGPAGWGIDRVHTEINFSVDHFFTPVSGSFGEFEVDLKYDAEHPEHSSVQVRIDVASIDTGNSKRDQHLRSPDWFDAGAHPHISFQSSAVRRAGEGELVATGTLEMRGNKRQIELPIKILGTRQIPPPMQAMLGGAKEVTSFEASTTIDRGDYQVGTGNWAATMVVGGEVEIRILAEAHRR